MTQAFQPSGRGRSRAILLKRILDVAVAGSAIVALSPVMGVVAFAVRVSMGPPVLFRQLRPGHHGVPFTLLKFRTMEEPAEQDQEVDESALVTPLGRTLRRTSLDELPQLWNVVRGDMSLVGPRPLAMDYLPHYTPEQFRRHEVRPGVTGWAQVTGRHGVTWEERFARDVWYVDHWSLWLDLRILAMTVRVLLSGSESIPPPTANFGASPSDDPASAA